MIQVVLDSSIYRADMARRGQAFHALERLARTGKVRIHVPYFVEQEVLSHFSEELRQPFNTVIGGLKELGRKALSSGSQKEVERIKSTIKEMKKNMGRAESIRLKMWWKRVRASMHPVVPKHGLRVAKDYFEGNAPFGEKKAKCDIPDAFIFHSVTDLTKRYKRVHFVVSDERLRKACGKQARIDVHQSLADFIATPQCQKLLTEEYAKSNLERIKKGLPILIESMPDEIGRLLLDSLPYTTFTDPDIPDDNHEATIETVGEPESVHCDRDGASYFGNGVFSIPFSAEFDAGIYYAVFKSDFDLLDYDRMEHMSISERNKHYYEVSEERVVTIDGAVNAKLDMRSLKKALVSDEQIKTLLDEAKLTLDEEMELRLAGSQAEY